MAAISTSSSVVLSASVVSHISQSMSAPSAVTVQVLSSSPSTLVVSRGSSVDNDTAVGFILLWSIHIWLNCKGIFVS